MGLHQSAQANSQQSWLLGSGQQTYLPDMPPATLEREHFVSKIPSFWRQAQLFPFLQTIEFPTLTPVEMTLYTDIILPRQGSFLRSMKITVSKGAHKPPDKPATTGPGNILYLSPYFARPTFGAEERPSDLSLKTMADVLKHCPNLRELILNYPGVPADHSEAKCLPSFKRQLISIMASVPKLEKFELECFGTRSVDVDCMVQVLKQLPLLESFACFIIGQGNAKNGRGKLLECLAGLPHLNDIYLNEVRDDLSGRWDPSYICPKAKSLGIIRCQGSSLLDMPKNISVFTPNLTKLQIDFNLAPIPNEDPTSESAYQPDRNREQVFCLPHLELLALRYDCCYDFIRSFEDCKNLRHLEFAGPRLNQLDSFSALVRTPTWPKLKYLKYDNRGGDDTHKNAKRAADLLKQYCNRNDVELIIPLEQGQS